MFAIVLLLYLLATWLPLFFSWRALRKLKPWENLGNADDLAKVTVLQPILGGDPSLATNLRANLALYPTVEFLWLVDKNDPAGLSAARQAQDGGRNCSRIIECPVSPPDQNPKVFKLSFAQHQCAEVIAVVDDDCVLQPRALEKLVHHLSRADLATGTPFYFHQGNFWTRLLASFPNGYSVVTYFSMLYFQAPNTINGMIYATRQSILEEVGGFAAIASFLCDDFELAKIYRQNRLTIGQSTASVKIRTTLPSPAAYFSIMRRWFFFGRRQLSELISARTLMLIVLPPALPVLCFGYAAYEGFTALACALGLFVFNSLGKSWLRSEFFTCFERPRFLYELMSDLLLPVHMLTSAFSREIKWRTKIFTVDDGSLKWSD